MDKRDLQALYRKIKREKFKNQNDKSSLFTRDEPKGCRTCGEVTWRPQR